MDLNNEYQQLLKTIKKNSETELTKREKIKTSLNQLFEIVSKEAEKQMNKDKVLGIKKAQEDLSFLESQRTGKKVKMAGQDKVYEKKIGKHNEKKEKYATFEDNAMMQLDSQFDIDESQGKQDNNNDGDFKCLETGGQRKRKA